MEQGFNLFDTAIGACGLAWGEGGIVGLQLPEKDRSATGARLRRRYPNALPAPPPAQVADVVAAIVKLTEGEKIDLTFASLDRTGQPEFNLKVYEIALEIRPGETLTYGEIARRVGNVALSRVVGQALGANPWPIIVPCHRVLAAAGRTGGFSAPGGVDTKLRLLNIERATGGHSPLLWDALPLAIKPRG